MSAVRLRGPHIEVRVDDETPISERPVTILIVNGASVDLTVSEALELGNAINVAALDALRWTIAEPCDGRIPHQWCSEYGEGPRRAPK